MNFNGIFLGEEKFFNRKVAIFHAALIFAALLFLYLFSYSTSPRYFFIGNDSLIFQVVGKCWTQGLLPYVGTFENKGPFLFAIDAIGWWIYPRYGIFPLQVPFMYFSLLFMWRAVELYWSRADTMKIFLFTIFLHAVYFSEGNRTEEYSMPFLLAAAYFFLRWLRDEKNFLPVSVGFFYGLGFGACVLLRTTNSLPLCCYVLLTTFVLIRAGAFKNILQNFLSFWAGFAAICLPFVIYFAAHGALYDMLYGTILWNVKIATGFDAFVKGYFEYIEPYLLEYLYPLYWLLAASIFLLVLNRKSFLAWSGIFTGAAMFFLLLKSRPFVGYLEQLIELLPIFFAVLRELKETLSPTLKNFWNIRGLAPKKFFCRVTYAFMYLAFLAGIGVQFALLYTTFTDLNSEETIIAIKETRGRFEKFQSNIPVEDRNSVALWGEGLVTSRLILSADILPSCRFFGNVATAFGKMDPTVIDEWIQTVRNKRPKWIVYTMLPEEILGGEMDFFDINFRWQRNSEVEKLLNENYILTEKSQLFGQIVRLYRLRE